MEKVDCINCVDVSLNFNHVYSDFAYLNQGKSAALDCDFRGKNIEETREAFLICIVVQLQIVLEMDCCRQWKPIVMMVAVNLGLAADNAFLKKILDGGLNHLVIVASLMED